MNEPRWLKQPLSREEIVHLIKSLVKATLWRGFLKAEGSIIGYSMGLHLENLMMEKMENLKVLGHIKNFQIVSISEEESLFRLQAEFHLNTSNAEAELIVVGLHKNGRIADDETHWPDFCPAWPAV